MNRLNAIIDELDAVSRYCYEDITHEEARQALHELTGYVRIKDTVRHYTRGGPVVWWNYCDICGCIWPHPDQTSMDCDYGKPCPQCGRSWDRLLVVDESDPEDVEMLEDTRLWWRCVDASDGDREKAREMYRMMKEEME